MIKGRELYQALTQLAGRSTLHQGFYRAVSVGRLAATLADTTGDAQPHPTASGRFHRKGGSRVRYFSNDPVTALAELTAFGLPRTAFGLVQTECRLQSVLDLTDPVVRRTLKLDSRSLRANWRTTKKVPTQELGECCATHSLFDGILYEAPTRPRGQCLAVFIDVLRHTGGKLSLVVDGAAAYRRLVSHESRLAVSKLTILAVATEWNSGHGGLSTFNRELCTALARAGHTVYCFLPRARQIEIDAALAQGVHITLPERAVGDDASRLFRLPRLPCRPDLIIGHGRVTGMQAIKLREDDFRGARLAQFVHVAPSEIEPWKQGEDAAGRAEERDDLEMILTARADIVVGVGPLLAREASIRLAGLPQPRPRVLRFDPGLPRSPVGEHEIPPAQVCLVMGRAEDLYLKGFDIAARAVALSMAATGRARPRLLVRGAVHSQGDSLRADLLKLAGRPDLDIVVRYFTSDAGTVAEDVRRASVVLVPSRAEGFGLAGLEAIAFGVPILISSRSGLAELLEEHVPQFAATCVVDVTTDLERDGLQWAERLRETLVDKVSAFERARQLREQLSRILSWDEEIARLVSAVSMVGPPPLLAEDS